MVPGPNQYTRMKSSEGTSTPFASILRNTLCTRKKHYTQRLILKQLDLLDEVMFVNWTEKETSDFSLIKRSEFR